MNRYYNFKVTLCILNGIRIYKICLTLSCDIKSDNLNSQFKDKKGKLANLSNFYNYDNNHYLKYDTDDAILI